MFTLHLTHDCDVNLVTPGGVHIYHPARKAGDTVASGQLVVVRQAQQEYARTGYGTEVKEWNA